MFKISSLSFSLFQSLLSPWSSIMFSSASQIANLLEGKLFSVKGADQGFLVQYCCPTVENLSPLGTQIRAFCVYPHRIGPEQRTKPIFIRTLHQGGHPRPHLASMLAAKQRLFSNKDSQLNLHCLIMQSFSTTTSHFNEEN